MPTAHLWLISAVAGDKVPGVDIALVRDEIAALERPEALAWMTAQGYGPGNPEDVMYLADEPGPDGWESLRLDVTPAEYAAWQAAADEQDDLAGSRRDGERETALRNLDLYRQVTGSRDELVRAAHAAGANIRRIGQRSGISRATIYKILEAQGLQERDGGDPS